MQMWVMCRCLLTGPDVPSVHLMETATNTKLATLEMNLDIRRKYRALSVPQTKIFQVELGEGFTAQVKLQLPPGFRDYEDMTFPLILKV